MGIRGVRYFILAFSFHDLYHLTFTMEIHKLPCSSEEVVYLSLYKNVTNTGQLQEMASTGKLGSALLQPSLVDISHHTHTHITHDHTLTHTHTHSHTVIHTHTVTQSHTHTHTVTQSYTHTQSHSHMTTPTHHMHRLSVCFMYCVPCLKQLLPEKKSKWKPKIFTLK